MKLAEIHDKIIMFFQKGLVFFYFFLTVSKPDVHPKICSLKDYANTKHECELHCSEYECHLFDFPLLLFDCIVSLR